MAASRSRAHLSREQCAHEHVALGARDFDSDPSPRTVMHIGASKTGTTYLQHQLASQRAHLRSHGWLYPGDKINQYWAFRALMDAPQPGSPTYAKLVSDWQPIRAEISEWAGDVIVSSERLAFGTTDQIGHVLAELNRDKIDVVLTLRDFGRTLPSWAQERYKAGEPRTFSELLAGLEASRAELSLDFWRAFYPLGVVNRWRAFPQVRSISIALNPAKTSRDSLWQRFAQAAHIPAFVREYPASKAHANPSLSCEQIKLLRILNLQSSEASEDPTVRQDLRTSIYRSWFANSRGGPQQPLRITSAHYQDVVREWAAQDIAEVGSMPSVFGDISDLEPDFGSPPTDESDPTELTVGEIALGREALAVIGDLASRSDGDGSPRRPLRSMARRVLKR